MNGTPLRGPTARSCASRFDTIVGPAARVAAVPLLAVGLVACAESPRASVAAGEEPAGTERGRSGGAEVRRDAGHRESAAGDSLLERLAAELVPVVEKRAGLRFRTPPRLARSSRAGLEEFLLGELEEELPEARARAVTAVYARLGLVPDTLRLRSLLRDLYLEQVVGYYDPASDTLFVRDELAEGQRRPVVVHELVHALQDQHMDLDSLMEARSGSNDATTAAQAALEGHATFVMMEWQLALASGGEVDLTTLPEIGRMVSGSDLAASATMPVLGGAPRIVRESLVFPYLGGLSFLQAAWREEPGRNPPLGPRLPSSTEQVLHPERYRGTDRDSPVRLAFDAPPPDGWRELRTDDLGEFETRIFLETFLADDGRARAAAAGWDGDRYRLLHDRSGREVLVWVTVWDSEEEADEFARGAREAFAARYGLGSGSTGGGPGTAGREGGEGAGEVGRREDARSGTIGAPREVRADGRVVSFRLLEVAGQAARVVVDRDEEARLPEDAGLLRVRPVEAP